ncbi:MAG: gliding motility-associated C-terminal domain-containing protein [Sphingobacteriales bacterium]|nr:gliding motility-associated C-terminal domain-containing protein [Sphingobacteriales bacterium]
MAYRCLALVFLFNCYTGALQAQCTQVITTFPYQESFELPGTGWTTGGSGTSWAWGTPSKPVINNAGDGTKCWMAGGLTTGTFYTSGEASWLQSPCFDFTSLQHPWLTMKLFWETEQQWDGASFQFSTDAGTTWTTLGNANETTDCLTKNWFNTPAVNGLTPLTATPKGWTGNSQPNNGSCLGGNGSKAWVQVARSIPSLAGKPSVQFRFIFGAGTTCNNYDGFAVDSVHIEEAPPNAASFTYTCAADRKILFTSTSGLCPSSFRWEFDEPLSSGNNTSNLSNPSHTYAFPGTYTVTLTVDGPGNAPSTVTQDITLAEVIVVPLSAAACETNTGGSLSATVRGAGNTALNYAWSTSPAQTTAIATSLAAGAYSVTVTGTDICAAGGNGIVELDTACRGIFFPSAFTPNADGLNDLFGPLGSVAAVKEYRLSIYNRWGERVYYSNNPLDKWDGRAETKKTGSSLYSWYCEFALPGKPKSAKKGTLLLIR